MSTRDRGSPVLEWTRMTSRQQSPYFVPLPTPGCSSVYDTEKVRRKIPVICMDKSPGRETCQTQQPVDVSAQNTSEPIRHRYGASQSEINAKQKAELRKKFMREREEYILSQGKMQRVAGVCNLSKGTGRDSPVLWHAQPTESQESVEESMNQSALERPSKTFTISKAPRFREQRHSVTPLPEANKMLRQIANDPAPSVAPSVAIKNEFGTFARSPPRPKVLPDNRDDLELKYDAVRGHLARNISFEKYASRSPGIEDKPSMKYKQLFKQLQRPHERIHRIRAGRGMSTMLSPYRGDLPSILKHADNDRLRAVSALEMNETSTHVKEILYPDSEPHM